MDKIRDLIYILHCMKQQHWYGVKTAWIETVIYSSSFVQIAYN